MTATVKKTGNRNVHLVTMDGMEEECGQMVTSVQEPCFIGEVRLGLCCRRPTTAAITRNLKL